MAWFDLTNIIKIVILETGGKRNQIPIDDIFFCFFIVFSLCLVYKMLRKFSMQETNFLYSRAFQIRVIYRRYSNLSFKLYFPVFIFFVSRDRCRVAIPLT